MSILEQEGADVNASKAPVSNLSPKESSDNQTNKQDV